MAKTQQILKPKKGGDITYMDVVDEQELGESQIQKLFVGVSVLVTGGTGFLGKLLVEKLLRSCHGLQKIYLLVRPKRNKNPAQRLEEQFVDVLYDRLKKEQPNFMEKVAIVEGDMNLPNLGISNENRQNLANEVGIIFNSAATVKFNQTLKTIIEINTRSTRDLLLLARACTKLKALVHVSTAYCHCLNKEIKEKFYDMNLAGDKLIDLVESLDEKVLVEITPHLIRGLPNTYLYSKWASEDIIKNYSTGLPVVICRPSMVVATAKEPIAGWIDNLYGPIGIFVGAGMGVLHSVKCNTDMVADMIPGDLVVNNFISAAWKVSKDHDTNQVDSPLLNSSPLIYNNVSSMQNPITWKRIMNYSKKIGQEIPLANAIWYNFLVLTTSNLLDRFIWAMMHWIPAYILDAIAVTFGKKPQLKTVYRNISKFSGVIEFFAMNEWKFYDDNSIKLLSEMCEADKQIFNFDVGSLDWASYHHTLLRGLRVYLMKEPLDTIPKGRRKAAIFKFFHYILLMIFVFSILALIGIALRFISKFY